MSQDLPPTRASGKGRMRRGSGGRGGDGPAPDRVGRYQILSEIARGGMGVVYRARDTRLDRLVALKALPAHVAQDAEARGRFEREARLLAALEHPHVASIYGIEDSHLGSFLVLQHVEGETLATAIARGPLAPDAALRLASQIASGVAAAHRRGIVHCDLKPGNVMVMPDGTVKLVDFGIATRFREPAAEDAAESMGTPAYMSPEQVGGLPLDPRTDVWSFGCTVVETLTGRPPFDADHPRILVAMIERADPDWSALPDGLPPELPPLLRRCLAKDREQRPADMEAVARELQAMSAQAAAPAPSALPLPLSSFVGRERELADVTASLQQARLLTLTGTAGCGKTRLVLEAARRLPGTAWFAGLAALAQPSHVPAVVAAAVGARKDGGDPDEAIVAALRGRQGLLILDNCEHVLAEAARVAERILAACPGIHVACTSREALGIAGEVSWRVPSLEVSGSGSDAMELFLERAREVRPGYEPDAAAREAIASILQRLDGIPLAIELAAARMRILTPQQILERLSDRFRLLTGGSRTALERHQTLRAALDWSYGLLNEDDKRCLRELSAFAGGFRLQEAAKVCTGDEFEILDHVGSLVSKSLVQPDTDAKGYPRYRLLESVRQHAASKLEDAGEAAPARDRHRDAYLEFAKESHALADSSDPDLMAHIEAERDNVRAALEWAMSDPATAPIALELAAYSVNAWDFGTQWREGREWLKRVLALPGLPESGWALAHATAGLGNMEYWLGNQAEAETHYRRSLELHEATGNLGYIASARMRINMITHQQGRLREARESYLETERMARDAGALTEADEMLINLCLLERDLGMAAEAWEHGQAALASARRRHAGRQEARALRMLGRIARDEDRLDEAAELIGRSLRIHERRGELRDAAASRTDLANVVYLRGDLDGASELFSQIAATASEWGESWYEAIALANLGEIDVRRGRLAEARDAMLRALLITRRSNMRTLQASVVAALGDVLSGTDPSRAAELLQAADAAWAVTGRRLSGKEAELHEDAKARTRCTIGDEAYAEAGRRAASRTLDEIVDEQLAALPA